MTKIIIILGIIFVGLFILKEILLPEKENTKKKTEFKYKKKDSILTKPEMDFYREISSVLNDKYILLPQVHLSSILEHKIAGQNWKSALNHIQRKSVDFVIFEKQNLEPKIVIEVDDSSHQREDRIERDGIVKEIFELEGLAFLRTGYSSLSNTAEMENFKKQILEKLITQVVK